MKLPDTQIWFEFQNPYDVRDKMLKEGYPKDKVIVDDIIKHMEKEYNAFFRRLGWDYKAVWWHQKYDCWCYNQGKGGGFFTTNMKEPGVWLYCCYIPVEFVEGKQQWKKHEVECDHVPALHWVNVDFPDGISPCKNCNAILEYDEKSEQGFNVISREQFATKYGVPKEGK